MGRLVNRRQGSSRTGINIYFEDDSVLHIGFSNRHKKHIEILNDNMLNLGEMSPVYIPPKEIISATENFGSLYADYHIAFEETYYDLSRLLVHHCINS